MATLLEGGKQKSSYRSTMTPTKWYVKNTIEMNPNEVVVAVHEMLIKFAPLAFRIDTCVGGMLVSLLALFAYFLALPSLLLFFQFVHVLLFYTCYRYFFLHT